MFTWPQVCVRTVGLAAAAVALVLCPPWVAEAYHDRVAYEQAPLCPDGRRTAGAADECVERTRGEVVDKQVGGCIAEDCAKNYRLRVRHETDTTWLSVDEDTFHAAKRGSPADLRLWHGTVVRVEAAGHTTDLLAPAGNALLWRLAGTWLLLGLAVCTAPGRHPVHLIPLAPGWLLLTPAFVVTADLALVGSPGVGDVLWAGALSLMGLVVLLLGVGALRSGRDG